MTAPLEIKRLNHRLTGDPRRTITRFFWLGDKRRAKKIVRRVLKLSPKETRHLLQATIEEFHERHPGIEAVLMDHYQDVQRRIKKPVVDDRERQLLIGAYFTMEYSFESAALFNPSMVPAIDQSNLEPGSTRFLMSLRAVGEGHISSIAFRRGVIDSEGNVTIDPLSPVSRRLPMIVDREFQKELFRAKLHEMAAYDEYVESILTELGDQFTASQMERAVEHTRTGLDNPPSFRETASRILWLMRSNYRIHIPQGMRVVEMVIFPMSPTETQGMEDMRLVRFVDDDKAVRYFGTYTAFNGVQILPQILEILPPDRAEVHTLHGKFARNKGIALFPRRINGHFAAIGRADGENLFYMESGSVRYWDEGKRIQEPQESWEFVQLGNCGSPIETDEGWLLLTHGVGPMRRYCMGATLLDRDNPSRIVAQLREPLLEPVAEERSGYVPNVVYSCGGMAHNGNLVIPYGISDAATGFVTVRMKDLLARLKSDGVTKPRCRTARSTKR